MGDKEPGAVKELHPKKKQIIKRDEHQPVATSSELPLEKREQLNEADSTLAFLQFALTGREYVEMGKQEQAGLLAVIDGARERLKV